MGEVIRKIKGGRFVGWYIRWREQGRRICLASKQPTAAEARKMLVQIEARVARGEAGLVEQRASERLTVAELCERFLREFHSPRVKDMERYQRAARYGLQRILPYVGALKLTALRRRDIERARDRLLLRYRGNTVRASLRPLGTALSWAVKQDLIGASPARGVELPRIERSTEHLAVSEMARLLAEAERRARAQDNSKQWVRFIAVALALRLGLRRGEVFGLRWQDVDFDAGLLRVAKSYHLAPKSNKPRTLPLPSSLAPLLREWRERCPLTAERLVCPLQQGGRWGMSSPRAGHGLAELLRGAACSPLVRGFHSLRHSFASAFVAQGGSLLSLRELLGHSSIEMTLTYSHLSSTALITDLEKLRF